MPLVSCLLSRYIRLDLSLFLVSRCLSSAESLPLFVPASIYLQHTHDTRTHATGALKKSCRLLPGVKKRKKENFWTNTHTYQASVSVQQTHTKHRRKTGRQTDKQKKTHTQDEHTPTQRRTRRQNTWKDTPNARVNAVLSLAPGLELQPLDLGVVPQPPHRHLPRKENKKKQEGTMDSEHATPHLLGPPVTARLTTNSNYVGLQRIGHEHLCEGVFDRVYPGNYCWAY